MPVRFVRIAESALLLVTRCFTALLILTTSRAIEAQQVPIVELEPVIVTATALPQQHQDTPATVSIITRSEIERMRAKTTSEVLLQVPGLHIDQMGSRGGLSSVYVRGGDPNFTLVMIDGIQINDPTNPRGGSVDLSRISPEHIERIEIVRGPLSSLYGSDAMAGTINIITRRGKGETAYDFLSEGGSFGYARAAATAAGAWQKLKYAISSGFDRNDEQVKKDKFAGGNIGVNLDLLDLKNASLRWTNYFTRTDARGFPEGSGGPQYAVLREAEERETQEVVSGIRLSLHSDPRWLQEISAAMFYRAQNVDTPGVQVSPGVFQLPPARFDTDYSRYQFGWKHTFPLAEKWSFIGSAHAMLEDGRRSDFQRLTAIGLPRNLRSTFSMNRFTPAVVAEMNAGPFSELRATTGFRVDFPEDGGAEFSPKLGIHYRAHPGTNLRLNAGRGFKLPSFNALGDLLIGNSGLKPEKSIGTDFGVEQRLFSDRHTVAVTYFYNRFSDLIDLDPDLAASGVFRLVNLSTVETQGLEASLNLRPTDSMSIKGYFNYLYSDIKSTDEPLRNRPRFSGGVVLDTKFLDKWGVRADLSLVGKKYDFQIPTRKNRTGAYADIDLSVSYAPAKTWRIYAVLENLTNTKHEDYVGFPHPGILLRFGFALQK